ncbi:PKD domain-containing protein [Quadrisphaera sp. DSM 44207]|uniref:PKD domain-containing protein n=1 Tax=Quadrisphaera sp. DSM 44207 TaxID=1881057 RepID=UPI002100A5F3|nr:PKD domain-containing protein [Quadrisphaera sp. DSM 44207]
MCDDVASDAPEPDITCGLADASCPPGEFRYWTYRSPVGLEPPLWELTGAGCYAEAEAAVATFPGFTLADFRRLPLPAADASVQPDTGYALLNVPTNVYATAEPVELDVDVVGFPVRVRATPARYSWSFGDGATLGPTSDPGAAYPDLRLTHTYTAAGAYEVVLTTHYTGQYAVAGGPWLPVDGEAQVSSAPVAVQALAGRNALVAGTELD